MATRPDVTPKTKLPTGQIEVWVFCLVVSLLLIPAIDSSAQNFKTDYNYASRMWYKQPSVNWNEALPIGNGRVGGMVYGGVKMEHIALNEENLWSGGPRQWNNPDGPKYLPLVRRAALAGNYREADSLAHFMQGPYTESFLPLGDLLISYPNILDSTNYTRELNMDSALSKVQFTSAGIKYQRISFSSFPDQVLVTRESSNHSKSITFTVKLSSKIHFTIHRVSANHLVLNGKCPSHVEPAYLWKIKGEAAFKYEEGAGMDFQIDLLVRNEGGTISSTDSTISVANADATTLFLSAATSFNGYQLSPATNGKDPSINSRKFLAEAVKKSYLELMQRHIQDYQPIFRRVKLHLGKSQNDQLPTDERLKKMIDYTDPEIVAMISAFGRYILIAASRPGGQPCNLKGIWNDRMRPEYSSNWCIDHDAQMFYYAVETNNLSEMHEPFLNFIAGLADNGRETAKVNYGMHGWCAHHNTDVWRGTGASGNYGEGNPHWANWNMAGPWLSEHYFEHYLFTGDKKFLKEKAWPIMKGAAEFCLDWLVLNDKGQLISVPSVSPENTFITEKGDTAQISVNTTSDISLMKDLFTNCVRTAQTLQLKDAFIQRIISALSKLQPYVIGAEGELQEWTSGEWKSMDPAHRHLSHMYPVFPGSEISPATTPDLSKAAKIALTLREKTNCSWGFAWKAGCWARLGEGDSAWNTWQYQLRYVDPKSTSSLNNYGLFPNFFNSDGRDVIMNGNGCATAVITEMLIQSHTGAIEFLPALPSQFSKGSLKGICARGGFVVDLDWENGTLTNALILSKNGMDCQVRNAKDLKVYCAGKLVRVTNSGNLSIFKTIQGKTYYIKKF